MNRFKFFTNEPPTLEELMENPYIDMDREQLIRIIFQLEEIVGDLENQIRELNPDEPPF